MMMSTSLIHTTRRICSSKLAASTAACVALVGLAFASAAQAEQRDEVEKPPEPKDVVLRTSDGLELHATFFPGMDGKESVPVILLHAWKEDRHDYLSLAGYLQSFGHAVIVPDLRGHGDSRTLA